MPAMHLTLPAPSCGVKLEQPHHVAWGTLGPAALSGGSNSMAPLQASGRAWGAAGAGTLAPCVLHAGLAQLQSQGCGSSARAAWPAPPQRACCRPQHLLVLQVITWQGRTCARPPLRHRSRSRSIGVCLEAWRRVARQPGRARAPAACQGRAPLQQAKRHVSTEMPAHDA